MALSLPMACATTCVLTCGCRWLSPNAPPSPSALMSSDPKRPVKQLLWEFNAQRMLSKVVKGAHRRLSTGKADEAHALGEGGPEVP
jgi:hypothetical protein